jgi:hypothetical protein
MAEIRHFIFQQILEGTLDCHLRKIRVGRRKIDYKGRNNVLIIVHDPHKIYGKRWKMTVQQGGRELNSRFC